MKSFLWQIHLQIERQRGAIVQPHAIAKQYDPLLDNFGPSLNNIVSSLLPTLL